MGGILPDEIENEDQHDRHEPNNNMDDIWGSEPSSPLHESSRGGNEEHSDIPRLKEKHETEGYRDGVTKGKAESVQNGFDEGYSLGAMLGLRIGKILGLLEGLVGAVPADEKQRVEGLLERAREELSTKSVFGREYWGDDGVWSFHVDEEVKDVTFEHVARAHPLVTKWEGLVEQEVEKLGLDLGIMDLEGEEDEDDEGLVGAGKGAAAVRKAADEPAAPPGKIMGISKSELNW